jgi:hypothetical protein
MEKLTPALYTPQGLGESDMKKLIFLLTMFVAGCNHFPGAKDTPGQWILESYDIHTGYKLRKDGVQYVAHCVGTWYTPKQSHDSAAGVPIPPGAEIGGLPVSNQPENSCAEILPYLHRAVPFSQESDVLSFKNNDYTTELLITEAK